MFHFCELDAAARMRPRAASVGPATASPGGQLDGSTSASQLGSPRGSLGAQMPGAAGGSSTQLSPMHSYAPSWSGSEASDLFPGSSTSSLATSAAAATAAAALGGGGALADSPAQQQRQHHHEGTPPRLQQAQRGQHGSARSTSPVHGSRQQLVAPGGLLPGSASLGAPGLASPGGVGGMGSTLSAGSGQLRLALPVQQRGAAKAAARLLREQLATAQADLQGEEVGHG